jgi:hypothetical protein
MAKLARKQRMVQVVAGLLALYMSGIKSLPLDIELYQNKTIITKGWKRWTQNLKRTRNSQRLNRPQFSEWISTVDSCYCCASIGNNTSFYKNSRPEINIYIGGIAIEPYSTSSKSAMHKTEITRRSNLAHPCLMLSVDFSYRRKPKTVCVAT